MISSSIPMEHNCSSSSLPVVDFYRNKSILITGGTGFIGKVLCEKLLRSCGELRKIYLLLRVKRNGEAQTAQQRLQQMIAKSRLLAFYKNQLDFSKLVAVGGDLSLPGLGLSTQDRQTLIEEVDIVFHSAASVRFHGPIKDFIVQNVHGTDSIMQLCLEMKHLQSVVYVSTAYANCNLGEVEERVYPLGTPNTEKFIEHILNEDSGHTPKIGHPSLLGRPNSYTISKAIAEVLVEEKYFDSLPVVICRPSIVTHAYQEPVDGWCDSLNGIAGTLILGGLGIARTMEVNCDYKADIIPVDFVVNSLVVIGAHTALKPAERQQVVHITSGIQNPITWGQILDYARMSALEKPSMKLVRPIAKNPMVAKSTMGKVHHTLVKVFSHHLFAYLFDLLLLLTGNQSFMVRVTRKMHKAFDVLEHFTSREWCFRYRNYMQIFGQLSAKEQQLFQSNVASIDWVRYCDSINMGSRRYLLHEDDSTIEQAKKRQRLLNIGYGVLDIILYLAATATVLYLIWLTIDTFA